MIKERTRVMSDYTKGHNQGYNDTRKNGSGKEVGKAIPIVAITAAVGAIAVKVIKKIAEGKK